MDMYPKYKSKFGYQNGNNQIDSYGVDHSGFSNRDEVAYQLARDKRENALMRQYNNQGTTENYPQYGTNFWGNSANNYGFGMTNIAGNIENMQNNTTPIPMGTAAPQMTTQPITPQVQHRPNTSAWDTVKQWGETATNGLMAVPKKIWETGESLGECELAKISPESRRNGIALGYVKEYLMDYPVKRLQGQSHNEIMVDSYKDLQNNLYGSNLGYYNPSTSCEDLLDDRRTLNMRKLGIK